MASIENAKIDRLSPIPQGASFPSTFLSGFGELRLPERPAFEAEATQAASSTAAAPQAVADGAQGGDAPDIDVSSADSGDGPSSNAGTSQAAVSKAQTMAQKLEAALLKPEVQRNPKFVAKLLTALAIVKVKAEKAQLKESERKRKQNNYQLNSSQKADEKIAPEATESERPARRKAGKLTIVPEQQAA